MEQTYTPNQNSNYELIENKKNFRFLNSGKLGLNLILDYLKQFQNFNQKFDEVFVPKYMGQWIYSSLNQKCLTTPVFTKNTKIIYIYHQFGVPQKIHEIKKFASQNKLIIIEDCAHILDGYVNQKDRVGYIGDFSIFSFSKFLNCYLLGGLRTDSSEFMNFLDNQINQSSKTQSIINYILIKLASSLKESNNFRKKLFNMNYSLYNFPSKHLNFLLNNFRSKIDKEIFLRSQRFEIVKKKLNHLKEMDYLQFDKLVLYKLPIVLDDNLKEKVKQRFDDENLLYEEMHFDVNRNILNPKYQKVLIIEIGSINKKFEKQIKIISEI